DYAEEVACRLDIAEQATPHGSRRMPLIVDASGVEDVHDEGQQEETDDDEGRYLQKFDAGSPAGLPPVPEYVRRFAKGVAAVRRAAIFVRHRVFHQRAHARPRQSAHQIIILRLTLRRRIHAPASAMGSTSAL